MIRIKADKELFDKFQEVADRLLELREICQNDVTVSDAVLTEFGKRYQKWTSEDFTQLGTELARFINNNVEHLSVDAPNDEQLHTD